MRQQEISGRYQERIWRGRQEISKGGRAKKIRARRKNNGRVYEGVQENSKRMKGNYWWKSSKGK